MLVIGNKVVSKTIILGSNPSIPTMNRIRFKYNGIIYYPKNSEKKLKQLGITWDDVEIIDNPIVEKKEEYEDPHRLHYFINPDTKYSITSIYSECTEPGYIPTTIEYLIKLWNDK